MSTLKPYSKIPTTQKAVVFEEHNGPLLYKTDFPVPVPSPSEILVNIKFSGVCQTDLHAWKGDWDFPTILPLVGGHEGAGIVVEVGSNVKNFKVGDYAGVKWINSSCGSCEHCETANEQVCLETVLSGYTKNGSFQEYATIDAHQAVRFPQGIDLAEGAPFLCAGVTIYKALKTANIKAGDWISITGSGGGLGSLGIQYAKAMGYRVLAIDTGSNKELLSKQLGAEVFIDYNKTDNLIEDIKAVTNGGPHAALDVAASQGSITSSFDYVRQSGTVVLVGLPPHSTVNATVQNVVFRTLDIRGTLLGNRADSREAVDFFVRGLVKSPITILGLSELSKVYEAFEKGETLGRFVLDTSR